MNTTTRPTRKDQARKLEWKDPNQLDVPESVVEYFKGEGYGLRWIRVIDPETKKPDSKNVYDRQREGYEFVRAEEVPSWEYAPSLDIGKWGDLIVIGDLALAKLPLEIDRDRKRKMREKTQAISNAIEQELYENKQLQERLPIRNDSKSRIHVGGGKKVAADD